MNLKKIIVLGSVAVVSAAVGILLPTMMSGGHGPDAAHVESADGHAAKDDHAKADSGHDAKKDTADAGHGGGGHGGSGHGGDAHGATKEKKVPKEGPCFIPFGRIVVNLNEPALIKYLSIELMIQTDGKFEDEVLAALEARKPILTTWLTSHLADKTMEDIRGKVGINRLRREIQDHFNSLLFKDGHERVQDIMFEEFHTTSG
jgi:flagellar basal body-associated protein FliL